MEPLYRPFVNLWDWVERVGGFPGQMMAGCLLTLIILALLNWISSKK
jgi:hypothetical protein